MFEEKVTRIQQKFEVAQKRIEAKFEYVTQTIEGCLSLVVAVTKGLTGIVLTFFKSLGSVALLIALLLWLLLPLFFGFFLGLDMEGGWGLALRIFFPALLVLLIVLVGYALRLKVEGVAPTSKKLDWRSEVFWTGSVLSFMVLVFHLLYFQNHTPKNPVVKILHTPYVKINKLVMSTSSVNPPTDHKESQTTKHQSISATNVKEKTVRTFTEIPALSEVNSSPFFRLTVDSIQLGSDLISCFMSWKNPSGQQAAACNKLTFLQDDQGRRYELKSAEGIELGTYEDKRFVPIPDGEGISAVLRFYPSQGKFIPTSIKVLTIHFRDVFRRDREWVTTIPINQN